MERGMEILLRLPPLYLMDTILLNEMGISWVPSMLDDEGTITTRLVHKVFEKDLHSQTNWSTTLLT
jgi:hypothetical protein